MKEHNRESVLPRTSPPPSLPVREFGLTELTDTKLPNGLRLIIAPRRELPLIAMQLVLPGGRSADPLGRSGLAGMTAALLSRGTATRSAQELARTIEQVGGQLHTGAEEDYLGAGVNVLTEYAELAFDVLGDVIINPNFPADEVEYQRQRELTELRLSLANPGHIADRALGALLYGPHPYGREPTEQALQAATRGEIVGFYQEQRLPNEALLVVVGDVPSDQARTRAEDTFGIWPPASETRHAPMPAPPSRSERQIFLVDRPGSTQAELRLGHLGVPGSSTERFALQVLNQILGGGASSRLFHKLREEKGYTYGAYSRFSFPRDTGHFEVRLGVRNEVVEPAITDILAELERLRASLVPEAELSAAKSYLIGSFSLQLETDRRLLGQIVSLVIRGLSLGDLATYPKSIEQVDAAAVKAAADRYIRPEQLAILAVGDAARIRDQLAQLGPVTPVDADGQRLPA